MSTTIVTTKKCKSPYLSYLQCQLARQTMRYNRQSINTDMDAMLSLIDVEAKRLSMKHHHSVAWFQHQFFQGGCVVHNRRAVSVFNAAKQIDCFLDGHKGECNEADKTWFLEIQMKLKELNGLSFTAKLPLDMQQFLKARTLTWHEQKHTSLRASTQAVVQDTQHTLEHVANELTAFMACTNMQTVLFAVKGKPEHTMDRFCVASEKGHHYMLLGMKKPTSDLVKEFEAYVLGDVQGLLLNHNSRLVDVKGKIRGLIRNGLGIPFVTSSKIGSLHDLRRLHNALTDEDGDKRCRWVTLSEADWETRKATYFEAADKAPQKRWKRKVQAQSESDESSSMDEEWGDETDPKRQCTSDGGDKGNMDSAAAKENEAMTAKAKKGSVAAKVKKTTVSRLGFRH
ncbi:hypothetical protein JB92DRAFT_3140723 [Gautieria morchelliformis]|nr:hypothetical protein JB92DRAFT_3140723 [Gautieria morchelliformis]